MNLTDFLIELAENPELTARFKKDPKEVMKGSGLSEEDSNLVLSGDPQAVRNAVDAEKLGDRIVTIVFVSVLLANVD